MLHGPTATSSGALGVNGGDDEVPDAREAGPMGRSNSR